MYKAVARLLGAKGLGDYRFRFLSLVTGTYEDLTPHEAFTRKLPIHHGRLFIPTAVDYPILDTHDGVVYDLPVIPYRGTDAYRNDKVIVLGESRSNGVLQGYWVTDYQASIILFDIPTALSYARMPDVGYWNAREQDGFLVPTRLPSFSTLAR